MKGVIKFLLNTGVGREIVRMLFELAIRLFKRKVLEKMKPEHRDNLRQAMEIADLELHADLQAGKVKPTDVL